MTQPPAVWHLGPLSDFIDSRSGNGKLIKGKQSPVKAPELFPGFSASGQDIWVEVAEHSGPGIVVSAVGARCGKTFMAHGEWTAVANTHVMQIRDGAPLDIKFLWYLCNDENWWIRSGTAQPFVKVKDTLQRDQLIPPIDEQHKIVEILDDHLSRLDAALADLRQAEMDAARFRASILNVIFSGLDGNTWPIRKIGDLGKWVTGSTPSSKIQDYIGEDVPFITPGDVGEGGEIVNFARQISTKGANAVRRLPANSVHLVCIGTIGKVGIARFETTSNQQINALVANEEIVIPEFAMWLLASPSMQTKLWGASSSTTLPLLNKGNLEKIEVRIPDLNTQRVALEEFERTKSAHENLNREFNQLFENAKSLRRSLLHEAFSGRLTNEVAGV